MKFLARTQSVVECWYAGQSRLATFPCTF